MAVTATREMPTVSGRDKNNYKDSSLNCVIAKGTKVEGNVQAKESIRLDGILVGDVNCDKKVVIGEQGRVEGKVNASDAYIMGEIIGEMKITGTLHLEATSRISGNVQAKKLVVEEGAICDGDIKIGA